MTRSGLNHIPNGFREKQANLVRLAIDAFCSGILQRACQTMWQVYQRRGHGCDGRGSICRREAPTELPFFGRINEPGGTRTHDLRIKSPLLYRLSYGLNSTCFPAYYRLAGIALKTLFTPDLTPDRVKATDETRSWRLRVSATAQPCDGDNNVANSTVPVRPPKPRRDFPLFPHRNGRWAKKVRGKFCYFGKWADDPKGESAIALWLDQKDELLAGRTPRTSRDELIVRDLCNRFLTAKEQQRDAGDITPRSFADYLATCTTIVGAFGAKRLVDDLAADDFQSLRASFAKRYGPHRLGGEVQRVRTVFKYGYDAALIDTPVRFGPTFKKPATRIMRAHWQKSAPKMFEAAELRMIIDTASIPLKAMILLGLNCGFGNHDCGTLPLGALDLDDGWVNYPRPKTSVERRRALWPDTIETIRDTINVRPDAKLPANDKLVFITRIGQPWAKEVADSPITKEFRKLLDTLKMHRPGLGFYTLRHVFETIAGGTKDQVAVDAIMGHVDGSMSGLYREKIEDRRLLAVSNHVRRWLFPKRKAK
jgi:integrase